MRSSAVIPLMPIKSTRRAKFTRRLLGVLSVVGCAPLLGCEGSEEPAETQTPPPSEATGTDPVAVVGDGTDAAAESSDGGMGSDRSMGGASDKSTEGTPDTGTGGVSGSGIGDDEEPDPMPSDAVGTQGVARGELLFSDDFERTDPEQNGWTSGYVNGEWTIDNGVLTASSDLQHSATLINRTAWSTGIFEFDVNHSGGNIFGFIANAGGHSFAALFARGGTVIINDQEFGRSARPAWPDLTPGVWYRVSIIVSRDAAEILLDGESIGVLESPGIGTIERRLFQLRNHQDGMTVSFDNFELWEVVE